MKKSILLAASILFIGAASLQAQTATTGAKSSEWSKVESSKVPASVQQSLKADKYKGWENSAIYYNATAKQYSVDIKSGTKTTSYLFDSNGQSVSGAEQKSMGSTIPGKDPGTPPAINPPQE